MKQQIGKFDQRVTLQRATDSTDSQGSVSKAWATLATVWASVENMTGQEATEGNERTASKGYRFTVRHQSALATLSAGDRLQWRAENFDLTAAIPMPEGRPDTIQITATNS